MLRGIGMAQSAPGASPALDAAKVALYRTAAGAIAPLRKSEGMRRVIRRLALGRDANYYYRAPKKETPDAKAS
jgi:hypothetical protein